MNRRTFLKTLAFLGIGAAAAPAVGKAIEPVQLGKLNTLAVKGGTVGVATINEAREEMHLARPADGQTAMVRITSPYYATPGVYTGVLVPHGEHVLVVNQREGATLSSGQHAMGVVMKIKYHSPRLVYVPAADYEAC